MILFLDDEMMFNESYIEALVEAGFEVEFHREIGKGLAYFQDHLRDIELVILDIMFAVTGKLPTAIDVTKTQNGLRTGEEILRIMNMSPAGKSVPKMILTNVAADDFYEKSAASKEVLGWYRKRDVLPSELVEIVTNHLKK